MISSFPIACLFFQQTFVECTRTEVILRIYYIRAP
jgi:hypothetical protein